MSINEYELDGVDGSNDSWTKWVEKEIEIGKEKEKEGFIYLGRVGGAGGLLVC